MSSLKSDCRKFSPNVFNKTKCQNCFRTKDVHSAEALENNRASRIVSKCGYLFVAPDWDFNVSINRTKRWQRRWFVLYDDGELTYALDEFPDTLPQGTIDMNKVLDVSDAESATGNEFAIAITTPDKVHFVKGTSREESKWWFDVLSRVLPRYSSRGKHKRNATFPCGKATIPTPALIAQEYCSEDDIRINTYERPARQKFLSSSELLRNEKNWMPSPNAEEDEDVFPPNDDCIDEHFSPETRDVEVQNVLNTLISQPVEITDDSEGHTNHRDEKIPKDYLSQLEELDSRRRHRRYLKRENRVQRSQRGRVDGVSKMLPTKNRPDKNVTHDSSSAASNTNGSAMAAAEKLEYLESIHTNDNGHSSSPGPNTGFDEKDISSVNDSPSPSEEGLLSPAKTNLRKSESLKNIPSEAESEKQDHVSGIKRYHSFKGSSSSSYRKVKPRDGASSLKKSKSTASAIVPRTATSTPAKTTIHSFAWDSKATSETTTLPSSDASYNHTGDGVFMRTGWLMRQTLSKDWSKHWFVLKDSSLTYYRDPSAEHCGIMDGILDLNQVSTIRDKESDRYYAFNLLMWDGKKHILAAETNDFRSMWMQALQYASNLWSSASKEDFICSEIVLPEHTFYLGERMASPSRLSSLPFIYDNSSLLETSSASSDDQSEYFSLVDEDEISDLSSSPRTLPPSPPINRNVMSLVKEKSRIRSSSSQKTPAPSTDTFGSALSDHDMDRTDDQFQDDVITSDHKDTFHSLEQDEGIDYSEFAHELMNEENVDSLNTVKDPIRRQDLTAVKREKLKLHLENQLFKENGAMESSNKESPVSPLNKTFPREYLHVSTPKTETREECRTCSSVKSKLIAAKEEIRKLKRELKEAHASFDNLEMISYKLEQDIKVKEDNYDSQIALMTAKIDDLTSKFSLAEKNYRQLKQKTLKSEGKERKRSSLKSREGVTLTKEYELKLCDLEKKIGQIENTLQRNSPESDKLEESSLPSSHGEYSVLPCESSDTSTSTEPSTSSSKGLFSRLQTLGSKVQDINSLLPEKDSLTNEVKNPKICLQVRDTDGSSMLDESDDWWTLSFNNSLKSLNKYIDEYPSNLLECQNMFSQKMHETLRWLTTSLQHICKESIKNNLSDEKILLLQNFGHFLDFCSREWCGENQQSDQTELCYSVSLIFDSVSVLKKIESTDDFCTLVKFDVTQCAFKVIIKSLCIALAEYEYSEPSDVFNLFSEIPQIRFFCPIVNNLFPDHREEHQHQGSVSERLQQLISHRNRIMSSLQKAKKVRFESLWNTLADVPVQDANMNTPRRLNSILRYVTSIATGIYQIAELQLNGLLHQSPYLLEAEQKAVAEWCLETKGALKDSLDAFMDDLKEQCPMIHESTVSLSDLSDATHKEITRCVTELSLLCVSCSVLNSLLSYSIKSNDGSIPDRGSNTVSVVGCTDEQLRKIHRYKSNSFKNDVFIECPLCTILNSFLPDFPHKMNWNDFVREYNSFNPRKNERTHFNFEDSDINLSNTCANCDSHRMEATSNSAKDMCNNITCEECDNWIQKFCASEKQHERERKSLELKYSLEMKQLEECLIKSSEVHEQEMLEKESELTTTTIQLQHLKTEYEDQIQTLKNLYEQKLHFKFEKIDKSSIRQTYKSEIEDLKDMFKKGLVAIENSHYRITEEMEKRHLDELALLKAEKERALELEAQATIKALEVIKKSHEQQLKEETKVIREDLTKKLKNNEECETFYCKYGSDLEKLKTEIVNITDMYSAKCLENVALEEKVNSLRHQLEEAHKELCILLTKNKEMDPNPIKI